VTSVSATVGLAVCSRRAAEAEGAADGRETDRITQRLTDFASPAEWRMLGSRRKVSPGKTMRMVGCESSDLGLCSANIAVARMEYWNKYEC